MYQDEDFVILGINYAESQEVVEEFVATFGVTFPVLLDAAGGVYLTYSNNGQSPFPLDYVIDQNGIIQYIATEYDPDEMITVIEELLGITVPPALTATCLLLEPVVPEGGYLPFEITLENTTDGDIPADDYLLLVEHFERTSCSLLDDPVFTHSLSPGAVLPPGPSTFRFDVGPLPAGISVLNPFATRISSVILEPEIQITDDCCFSWRASPHPLARDRTQLP